VPFQLSHPRNVLKNERRGNPANQTDDVLGPLIEGNFPVLTDGTFESFLAAFNKRCNYHTDQCADPKIIAASKKLLNQLVPDQLPLIEWTKDTFLTWLKQFEPAKQVRLIAAVERFPLFRQSEYGAKDVFEKVELLMKRHDPEFAGRIVNASTDLHNALSGPILSECLKRLVKCAALDADAGISKVTVRIAYGATPQDFVQYIDGDGPFIAADYTANDKMQVADVSMIERDYAVRLGMPIWIAKATLRANKYSVTSRKFGLKASLANQLPSGSTSTTFRNSIWNATIFYAWAKRFGLHIIALILGDDMLAMSKNGRLPKRASRSYAHHANLARMKAKVFVYSHLVDCDFLSRHFVPSASGHLVIPKFGKAFGRFNARSNNGNITHQEYIAGKSLSYAYEFRHSRPMCNLFLERFVATGMPLNSVPVNTFTYSFRSLVLNQGVSGAMSAIRNASELTNDDMTCYTHYRYGKFFSEVLKDLEELLFGDTHLSELRAATYLVADIY